MLNNLPSTIKNLLMGSDMDPQSNLLKYFPYIMNGGMSNFNSNMPQDILNPMSNQKNNSMQNSKIPPSVPNPQNNNGPTTLNPFKQNLNSGQMNSQHQFSGNGINQILPPSNGNNNAQNFNINVPDYNKLFNLGYMPGVSNTLKPGFFNGDMEMLGRGLIDSLLMNNNSSTILNRPKTGPSILDNLNFEDPFFIGGKNEMYNKLKEKNKFERSLKIEKYKAKKRNWAKKISYDCRKRVADTRLRIKGRFISKKVKYLN